MIIEIMSQSLCIKCGADLTVSAYCDLCHEPLTFECTKCNYRTDEKVHADCDNAESLTSDES